MRLTGVANMASMVPRSHSRAKTREVSRVPMRVMMTVMAPGTRNCTLLAVGLYQKRVSRLTGGSRAVPPGREVRCQLEIRPWL